MSATIIPFPAPKKRASCETHGRYRIVEHDPPLGHYAGHPIRFSIEGIGFDGDATFLDDCLTLETARRKVAIFQRLDESCGYV